MDYLAIALQYFGHMYAFVNLNKVRKYDARRLVSKLMQYEHYTGCINL